MEEHEQLQKNLVFMVQLLHHTIYPSVIFHNLLGEIPESADKVKNLHHIKATNCQTSGTVICPVHTVSESISNGSIGTSHEVIEEVVHQLDNVHDGLGALDDLSVEWSLDIGLEIKSRQIFLAQQ